MNYVLEYLTSLLYHKKLLYRRISLHRSVIPADHVHHVYVDDKPVGQYPLVCSLLSGIFNSSPPQPKYLLVWNFQVVLNFIKTTLCKTNKFEEKNLAQNCACPYFITKGFRDTPSGYYVYR